MVLRKVPEKRFYGNGQDLSERALLRTKRLAPLCYFLLLTTVIVWGLSGLSFFFDAFRIPLFVPVVLWLSVAALHLKADHFYRIHKVSDEKDVYVAPTDPGSILARATENDDRIILVAAAGGGIQAAAWTARVLTPDSAKLVEARTAS
jgi:hypothetical protein